MKTIKEYYLDNLTVGQQTRYISHPSEIVDVHYDNTDETVTLISIENKVTSSGSTLRTFQICDTNETIYHEGIITYLGSFDGAFGTRYIVELK